MENENDGKIIFLVITLVILLGAAVFAAAYYYNVIKDEEDDEELAEVLPEGVELITKEFTFSEPEIEELGNLTIVNVKEADFHSLGDGRPAIPVNLTTLTFPFGTRIINIEYDYTISTINPDAYWMFDWGDGTYSNWVSLSGTEQSIIQSHSWNVTGIYQIRTKYKSTYVDEVWSPLLTLNITKPNETDFPNIPSSPQGETGGITNVSYSYSTYATDDNGDNIQYRFNWSDGTMEWFGPYGFGEELIINVTIPLEKGTYELFKVKARDI